MQIAVLIPCYNEATTIGAVAPAFRAALPDAAIYVYDNNSRDGAAAAARTAGGEPRLEPRQGKGEVVRRRFADVEADVYRLVDGDAAYHAPSARDDRQTHQRAARHGGRAAREGAAGANRAGHEFGNRALSRRFVKSVPALSHGFETETGLTVHALSLSLPAAEIDTPYFARPQGSASKLSTFRDGLRIVLMIVKFMKEERPLSLFSSIGAAPIAIALVMGMPIFVTYAETGLAPRFPTATGVTILGFLSFAVALTLDSVRFGRRETRRRPYLQQSTLPDWRRLQPGASTPAARVSRAHRARLQ